MQQITEATLQNKSITQNAKVRTRGLRTMFANMIKYTITAK